MDKIMVNSTQSEGIKILLLINSCQMGDLQGFWYSALDKTPTAFNSFLDFYIQLNEFYDKHMLAQKSTSIRRFQSVEEKISKTSGVKQMKKSKGEPKIEPIDQEITSISGEDKNGEKATFLVQVLYRQNSTWQGTVKWLEKGEEVNFRSAMELMQIIDGTIKQ